MVRVSHRFRQEPRYGIQLSPTRKSSARPCGGTPSAGTGTATGHTLLDAGIPGAIPYAGPPASIGIGWVGCSSSPPNHPPNSPGSSSCNSSNRETDTARALGALDGTKPGGSWAGSDDRGLVGSISRDRVGSYCSVGSLPKGGNNNNRHRASNSPSSGNKDRVGSYSSVKSLPTSSCSSSSSQDRVGSYSSDNSLPTGMWQPSAPPTPTPPPPTWASPPPSPTGTC